MTSLSDDAIKAAPGSTVAAVAWAHRGQLLVTVVAKATFAFAFDADMPRVPPEEIARADLHESKVPSTVGLQAAPHPGLLRSPTRSARVTSDLAPYLPFVDVVFTGHAHAQGGPVRVLPVRLTVVDGDATLIDKRLLVQDAAGFERMPLVYERAYGGPGVADNPAGVGSPPGTGEPNVIDPEEPRRPAGFGPIGRSWPARKRLLGSTARKYLDAEVAQIPDDFDWTYYQVAPPDQQAERMSGGAWIMLEGLCPAWPFTRMRLPDVSGFAFVYGASGEGEMIELALDTVRLDGDAQRCSVVLRGSLPVEDEAALGRLRIVAGVGSAGHPLTWPAEADAPPEPIPMDDSDDAPGTLVVVRDDSPLFSTLPFVAGEPAPPPAPPPPPSSERAAAIDPHKPRRIRFPGVDDTADLEVDPQDHLAVRPAVPFRRASSSAMRAVRAPPPSRPPPSTGTVVLAPADPPPPRAEVEAPPPSEPKAPPRREAIVVPSMDTGSAPPGGASQKAAQAPPEPPSASPALKQALYGRYGKR